MQNAYILPGGVGVASSRECVEVFLALTQGERNALKAVASGMVGTVNLVQLGKLKSLDLVHHDGRNIALTTEGQAVVALIDRTRDGA
jgi:predicted transcriptional regulator